MNQQDFLYCELKDFQEVIPNLSETTQVIKVNSVVAQFPALGFPTSELVLDCEDTMWVRGKRRKYCRKVVFAHFSSQFLGEDYILYHICDA